MSLNRIIISSIVFCNLVFASFPQREGPDEDVKIDLHSPRAVPTRPYSNPASPRFLGSSKTASAGLPSILETKKYSIVPCLNLRTPLTEIQNAQMPQTLTAVGKEDTIISTLLGTHRVPNSPRSKVQQKIKSQEGLRDFKREVKSYRPTTLERGEQQKKALSLIRQMLKESDQAKVAELKAKLAEDYTIYKEMLEQQKAYEVKQKQGPATVEDHKKALAQLQSKHFAAAQGSVNTWLETEMGVKHPSLLQEKRG